MPQFYNQDTIAAIATPNAPGGIGIVRISGNNAVKITADIFKPINNDINLINSKGYKAHFGYVYYNDIKIDEAVCLIFRAPKSYTGEDVCEISCHGGLYIMKKVLRAAISAGARPAQAGEFTKRAFFNGKIDLSQAESVMNLISAQGQQAALAALNTLDGKLSKEIDSCIDSLTGICATLSAFVDYPDDEIDETTETQMRDTFVFVKSKLTQIINRYDSGKAITQGIDTVIVGKPNVGKSSLMNTLSGYEKSIVTDIAGTTRDIVEEKIILGDVVLKISDTAGIHETDNTVESIGVEMAKKRLNRARLVLAVFDVSRALTDEDMDIISLCREKTSLAIISKTDLEKKSDTSIIYDNFKYVCDFSVYDSNPSEKIEKAISQIFNTEQFDPSTGSLTGERQRDCCLKAVESLEECISALDSGMTLDAVCVSCQWTIDKLLELSGKRADEKIIDEIFSRFCVGK